MNSDTTDFLRHILPEAGLKCAAIFRVPNPKGGEAPRHFFTKSFEELSQALLYADKRGVAVYHACASFEDGKTRTQRNVHSVKSFWVDVDAGPGKPYANARDGARAVLEFCTRIKIPAPIFVSSGAGAHCYWVVDEELPADVWLEYSRGLRALAAKCGLDTDTSRTCDSASILRTPGTHWRKEGERLVDVGPLTGPYPIECFDIFLDHTDEQNGHAHRAIPTSAPQTLMDAAANVFSPVPTSATPIAELCGQMGEFRDSGGRIIEPLWYAGIGVLAFTDDGQPLAHEWSKGHETYTYAETQEKYDRAKKLSGPTTCAKFHSLNPKVCEACPHFRNITSPVILGRGGYGATPEASTPPAWLAAAQSQIALPQLPPDYAWRGGQLVLRANTGKSNVDIVISNYPIYLHSVATGEVRGEFNYTFQQLIPERGWIEIAIPAKVLLGAQGSSELAQYGANVHDFPHFVRYVKHSVDKFYAEGKLVMQYDQFGWKENGAFLFGKKLYHPAGVYDAVGNHELNIRSQWVGPNPKGSLARWTQLANSLFAAGCEAQSIALLASFAAPLMKFQASDEGGAIVSLVSPGGTGKSTALAGAFSVWGQREGLSLTNSDTRVSKFLSMGALGNLPVVYDEIESRDPIVIRDFIINFTNGRDKMRATRNGEIRHTASTWQTLLISASNGSLIDVLSITGSAEAPTTRIIELPLEVPPNLKHALGDKLKEELTKNAGHAGDAYLRWLVQEENLTWVRAALAHCTAQMWARTKFSSEFRFWIRTMAAIAIAGLIVQKLKIVEFSTDRIIKWLIDFAMENAVPKAREDLALDRLGMFINDNLGNILAVNRAFVPGNRCTILRDPRYKLTIRYEVENQRMYIATSALREWLAKQEATYNGMLNELAARKIVTDKRKLVTLAAGTDYPSVRTICIEIDTKGNAIGFDPLDKIPDAKSNVIPLKAGLDQQTA